MDDEHSERAQRIINQAKFMGFNREKIRQMFVDNGWSNEEIEKLRL